MWNRRLQATPRTEEPGAVMRFIQSFDFVQIAAMAVLLGIGVVFIHSTGVQVGTASSMMNYLKQLQWITLGSIVYFSISIFDYRKLLIPTIGFYVACLVLLVLVFFIGLRIYGAQRWINLPGLGMRLQPSELAKLAVIMVLAALFSSRIFSIDESGEVSIYRKRSGQLLGLIAAGVLIATPFLLIVRQPDLGSALILPPIGAAIIFVAGLRWRIMAWLLGILLLVFTLAVTNEVAAYKGVPIAKPLLKNYQRERILTFLDPERDISGSGHNVLQARLAVGSGGMFGKGIGQGTQNLLGFLPQTVSNNDFIFSVIAEETGFLGCLILLSTYLVLFYSILRTAVVATDPFGRYIAVGIFTMLFAHVYINLGMSIGLAPVTGLPLPLVSYGGSFTMTSMASLGLLQSIYRHRELV